MSFTQLPNDPTEDTHTKDNDQSLHLHREVHVSSVLVGEAGPSSGRGSRRLALGDRVRLWLRGAWARWNPFNWHSLMGWPLLVTYFILTFAQELPDSSVGRLLGPSLHFESDEINQYYAATFVPWSIRPVYAFISDQVPLFGYRRRPYFIISAAAACVLQVCMALFGTTQQSFAVLAVSVQLFLAISEVACDSLTVEWGNELSIRIRQKLKDEAEAQALPNANHSIVNGQTPNNTLASPRTLEDGRWSEPLLLESAPNSSDSANASSTTGSSSSSTIYTAAPSSPHASIYNSNTPSYRALTHQPSVTANHVVTSSLTIAAADPTQTPAELFTQRVMAHIIKTTPKETKLTPLLIKSRIQSECMSIRSAGSLFASATSILMMRFIEPRMVLFWSSFVFPLGILAIVWYVQEKKIGRGLLFLSQLPENEINDPTEVRKPTVPNPTSHPCEQESKEAYETKESAIVQLAEPVIDAGHYSLHHPQSIESATLISNTTSSSSLTPTSSSDDEPETNYLCGLSGSHWLFLYRKLVALLKALQLLFLPLLFIFIVNLLPTSGDVYYLYLNVDYEQFTNWQYGLFNFVGLSGSMIGCLIYQGYFAQRASNIKTIFVFTTIISAMIGCSEIFLATKTNSWIGLDDQWFVIIDSFLVSGFGILAQLPPIILASYYAPRGYGLEGSMFSLFLASAHLGQLASAELSAEMTRQLNISTSNWSPLWKMILICNLLSLLPLLTMPLLLREPKELQMETTDMKHTPPTNQTTHRDHLNSNESESNSRDH